MDFNNLHNSSSLTWSFTGSPETHQNREKNPSDALSRRKKSSQPIRGGFHLFFAA